MTDREYNRGAGSEVRRILPTKPARGRVLVETAGCVGQHRVHLAGLRGEIRPHHDLSAIIARDLIEQAFEFGDVSVYGLLELAIRAVAFADLVERLLALHRVETPREDVALAAIVPVPELRRRVVIDHARNV